MITFYSPEHAHHTPQHVFEGGSLQPSLETPERAFALLAAAQTLGPALPPEEFGVQPLLAVHNAAYLDYLEHAYARWVAEDNDPAGVIPSTFAVRWMNASPAESMQVKPGYYAFDTSTPITAGTWQAARAAANTALSGAKALLGGEKCAYALCRPPGHHAGRDTYGGYCYLSNAAIAAQYLLEQGRQRTAILDIDLHHGNGTQQIFYERADVLYVSIHIDPATHYPHFFGYTQETGSGKGLGYNLNIPLPAGTGDGAYLEALAQALAALQAYAPEYLLASVGFDAYKDDPVGGFALSDEIYAQIGAGIGAMGLPTLFVQEGGYHLETLGAHLLSVLKGYEENQPCPPC